MIVPSIVPTKWRCDCGQIETPETRCGIVAPWERDDQKLWNECEVFRKEETQVRKLIPESVHGKPEGYQDHRCRCERCKTWNREYMK